MPDHIEGSRADCPGCREFKAKQTSFVFRKGRPLFAKSSRMFPKPPEGAGACELGKTAGGKAVWASGAETKGFQERDHVDAAKLHALAMAHHDGHAQSHGEAGKSDDDWRRADQHDAEADRHGKLSEHHLDLVRDHLLAAGRGQSAALDFGDDGPALGAAGPADEQAVTDAKTRLEGRTHHDHPGGLTEADRAAYAAFTLDEEDGDADADGAERDGTPAGDGARPAAR